MRTAVLIAAAAAALTLSACNRPDEAATDGSTEAADAAGAATDAAAATGGGAGGGSGGGSGGSSGGSNGGTRGSASGETMDPASGRTVTDGAMTPSAQPGDTAGNNVTETQRRLNPPTPQ